MNRRSFITLLATAAIACRFLEPLDIKEHAKRLLFVYKNSQPIDADYYQVRFTYFDDNAMMATTEYYSVPNLVSSLTIDLLINYEIKRLNLPKDTVIKESIHP